MSVAIVLKSPLAGVISKYPPIPPWRLASPERGFWLATFFGLQGNFRHTSKKESLRELRVVLSTCLASTNPRRCLRGGGGTEVLASVQSGGTSSSSTSAMRPADSTTLHAITGAMPA